MSADGNFAVLNRLAHGPDDRELLARIAADRERILAGELLSCHSSPFDTLTLDLGRRAPCRAPGRPRPPQLRAIRFHLRRDLAPASVDTIVEIFHRAAHTKLPGFRGEAGGTVVDIGANEGFYSMRLRMSNPALRIVAAEPLAEHREIFAANLGDASIYPAAITNHDGETLIECYPHVGSVASLDIAAFPRPWIRRDRIRRRRVSAACLRSFLDTAGVDEAEICKMDIEGAEADVLSREAAVFRRFRRVVVECHGRDVRRLCVSALSRQGFRVLFVEPKRSGDVYFERR